LPAAAGLLEAAFGDFVGLKKPIARHCVIPVADVADRERAPKSAHVEILCTPFKEE
jgi:hypothetical protein